MNTATSGGDPMPPQAEKNTEMSGNISDVSQQKVNAVNPDAQPADPQEHAPAPEQEPSSETSPDYSVYLSTAAASAAAHGIFVVIPDPNPKDAIHTTKKMPETQGNPPQGERGVKSYMMTATAAVKTAGPTRFLGRRFGAGDGIIALDCDGWHPPADWTRGTGYRETSASGTGEHIIARIPKEFVPSGINKIKRPHAGGGDIEIFYGRGNGIAISGRDATAGPIDLDMESEAGRLVTELLKNSPTTKIKATSQQVERGAADRDEQKPDTTREKGKTDGELSFWDRFVVKTVKANAETWHAGTLGIPDTASEAMLSVCTRAAYDLAKLGYPIYHPSYATAIFEVFLASGVYEEFYAPGKGHDAHPTKVKLTLGKAVDDGRKRYGGD